MTTNTMNSLKIKALLESKNSDFMRNFNEPAMLSDIAKVKIETSLELPHSISDLLKMFNGEKNTFIFGEDFTLLSTDRIVQSWQMHVDVLNCLPENANTGIFDSEVMAHCDMGIKPYIANRKWLPFAESDGSITRYIDFDPAPNGKMGQIIEVYPEATEWRLLAENFEEYLIQQLSGTHTRNSGTPTR